MLLLPAQTKRLLAWLSRRVTTWAKSTEATPAAPPRDQRDEPVAICPSPRASSVVIESARPRHGRRFQPSHELALHNDAEWACATLPGAQRGLVVIRELVGPIGIPDLTAVVGPTEHLEARLALGIPPLLNEVDAAVVSAAHAVAPRTLQGLATKLGWPEATVGRRLPGLIRTGALRRAGRDSFMRPAELVSVGRIYAVEAKVRDASAALRQVRTYTVWADSYVLVLGPLAERTRERLSAQVEQDRGGLVIAAEWVRRPVIHPLPAARRLWASEHVVAALTSALPAFRAAVDR